MSTYRIDDLARAAGTTVRNVRAYQDRGLLAPPRREGRVAWYDERHLRRLRLIDALAGRGYSLAAIRDVTAAYDGGLSLAEVLHAALDAGGPWPAETPEVLTADDLFARFPGSTAEDLALAVRLGMVVPRGKAYEVPSPRYLAVGLALHAEGVPLAAILAELEALQADMQRIVGRFVRLGAMAIQGRREAPAGDALAALVAKLLPLARTAIDAELAHAIRAFAGGEGLDEAAPAVAPQRIPIEE